MHKILSFRIVPVLHRIEETRGLTLVTRRRFAIVWILGLRIAFNLGFHAND